MLRNLSLLAWTQGQILEAHVGFATRSAVSGPLWKSLWDKWKGLPLLLEPSSRFRRRSVFRKPWIDLKNEPKQEKKTYTKISVIPSYFCCLWTRWIKLKWRKYLLNVDNFHKLLGKKYKFDNLRLILKGFVRKFER